MCSSQIGPARYTTDTLPQWWDVLHLGYVQEYAETTAHDVLLYPAASVTLLQSARHEHHDRHRSH